MKRQFGRTMVTLAAAAMITAGLSVTALAAEGGQKNEYGVIDRTTKYELVANESTRPPQVGWVTDSNGTWYRLADGSYLANVWYQAANGNWYFLNEDGYRVTGWQNIDGVDYYFEQDGHMLIGWQKIDGNWYFFEFVPDSSRGIMYAETQTPDGYMTDAEGVIQ